MSARETILAAVATILTNASIAGGRIYRTRREQIPTLPAVVIEQAGASAEEVVLSMADHTLTVAISVLASGDTPDTAADATLLAIHTALQADLTLGISNEVQLQTRWDTDAPEVDDYDYIRHTHRYYVNYRTATGSF